MGSGADRLSWRSKSSWSGQSRLQIRRSVMASVRGWRVALGLVFTAWLAGPGSALAQGTPTGLSRIEHIVVLYMENRSFDHAYGNFPGANGLANAGDAAIQVDANGKPYDALP